MLEKYFIDTPIKADEIPEAVEVSVEADLTQHGLPVLIGVLDLVRSKARIVDFKSAAKTPDTDNRKARVGRNPATGETIQIKAKRVVKFRVAKAAKDAILGVKK